MKKTLRVFLIDDHPMLIEGVRSILSIEPDIEIVGEAGNGYEALQLCRGKQIDVILLDLQLPLMEGIDFLKAYRQAGGAAEVLILSTYSKPDEIQQIVEAGAKGYLLKDSTAEIIIEALHEVARGEVYFQAEIVRKMDEISRFPKLTEREAQILNLLAEGLLNKEIAEKLGISEGTTKVHLCSVFRKLRVSTRTEAICVGEKHGLIRH
ncbi:MAG: response regulator [Opitutales bacterium]